MPSYWYCLRDNKISENDDEKTIETKRFNERIVAARKPYFMTYVYPNLRIKNSEYQRNSNYDAESRYFKSRIHSIGDLKEYSGKTEDMNTFLDFYERQKPVGEKPCVVNRICNIVEGAFDGYMSKKPNDEVFDYNILKSNVEYSKSDYNKISRIYNEYLRLEKLYAQQAITQKSEKNGCADYKTMLSAWFRSECEKYCTNEDELCDIILDICYQTEGSKRFAWDICGEKIVENVLRRANNVICYPEQVETDGDFTYFGKQFVMREKKIGGDELVDYLE